MKKVTRVSDHAHRMVKALEGAAIFNEQKNTVDTYSMVADARRNLYEYIESMEARLLPDDLRDIQLRF